MVWGWGRGEKLELKNGLGGSPRTPQGAIRVDVKGKGEDRGKRNPM